MGEGNSKSHTEDQFLNEYKAMIQKKRTSTTKNDFNHPINPKTIKANNLDILNHFCTKGLLLEYKKPLKKFIQDYKEEKYTNLITNFIFIKNNEGQREFAKSIKLLGNSNVSGFSVSEFRQTIFNRAKVSPSFYEFGKLKEGSFEEKFFHFLEIELSKRDNFFFEISAHFGDIYQQRAQKVFQKFLLNPQQEIAVVENRDAIFKNGIDSKQSDKILKSLLEDCKEFIQFLNICLKKLAYDLSKNAINDQNLVPDDDLLNRLINKIAFGKNKTYSVVLNIIKLLHHQQQAKINKSLQGLIDKRPEEFGIDDFFCLKEDESPYQAAVDSLNYLNIFQNPFDKFQTVHRLRNEIGKCVDKYWMPRQENMEVLAQKRTIGGDQLLPLYYFILGTCGNQNIKFHQVFMEEFLDENLIKFGETGYYFTTFTATIDYLLKYCDDPQKCLVALAKKQSDGNGRESEQKAI